MEWNVLNEKDFGGPQKRKRLFIVGCLNERCTGEVFPFIECNTQTLKQLIAGSQGQRVYDISGTSCTLTSGGGGWGGKCDLYFIDLNYEPKITDSARCIKARYNSGITNRKGENSGIFIPNDKPSAILTPDREKVRQQGRRIKNPNEEMFCLTAQDRHGIAMGLSARGKKIHLTTTDPAAHLKFVINESSCIIMSHIDEHAELKKYQNEVLAKAKETMSDEDIAYVEEDLRSPCTQEIAVFRAFAKIVEKAENEVVVIDTAPTGHTLLLLDSTQSYNQEIKRSQDDIPESAKKVIAKTS